MERIAGRRRRVGALSRGSNPVRRKVNRIKVGVFAGLLVTFLIGAPLLAIAAGRWEYGAAVAEQRAQQSVHLVTAVLLQDVPDIVADTGAWDAGALARWTASDGKSRVGLVLDTAGAKAGSRLSIWVDGSGRPADPPLTRRDVRSRVITAAALAPAALAITLLATAIWLRWLLNVRFPPPPRLRIVQRLRPCCRQVLSQCLPGGSFDPNGRGASCVVMPFLPGWGRRPARQRP